MAFSYYQSACGSFLNPPKMIFPTFLIFSRRGKTKAKLEIYITLSSLQLKPKEHIMNCRYMKRYIEAQIILMFWNRFHDDNIKVFDEYAKVLIAIWKRLMRICMKAFDEHICNGFVRLQNFMWKSFFIWYEFCTFSLDEWRHQILWKLWLSSII